MSKQKRIEYGSNDLKPNGSNGLKQKLVYDLWKISYFPYIKVRSQQNWLTRLVFWALKAFFGLYDPPSASYSLQDPISASNASYGLQDPISVSSASFGFQDPISASSASFGLHDLISASSASFDLQDPILISSALLGLQDPNSALRATFGPKDLSSTCKASPHIRFDLVSTSLSTFDKRRLGGDLWCQIVLGPKKPNPLYIRA